MLPLNRANSPKMSGKLRESLDNLLSASREPDSAACFVATMTFAATAIASYMQRTEETVGKPDDALVGEFPELEYARDMLHAYIQQNPMERAILFGNLLLNTPENYEEKAAWNREIVRTLFGAVRLHGSEENLVTAVEEGQLTLDFGANGRD